jgi:hypothetical protein
LVGLAVAGITVVIGWTVAQIFATEGDSTAVSIEQFEDLLDERDLGTPVQVFVRQVGTEDWATSASASPGSRVELLIRFTNATDYTVEMMAGVNLAKYTSSVPGSTSLRNGVYPDGISISNDNIVNGGINVGRYAPGSVGYVTVDLVVDVTTSACGYRLAHVGVVRGVGGNEIYNTATIDIDC